MSKLKLTKEYYKKAWSSPFGIALLVYYFTMAIIGMLIPDDILTNHSWAREFSDFMASLVPQIDRITALNIKPNVNRFYFSVLWATSPIVFLMFFIKAYLSPFKPNEWIRLDKSMYLIFIYFCLGVFGFIIWPQLLWWVDPSLHITKSQFGSAFGRGFTAQIIFVNGPVMFLALMPFSFRAWCSTILQLSVHEK